MKVLQITSPAEVPLSAVPRLTDKQIYDEINCYRAQKLVKKMLDADLITLDEYNQILAETRKIFVPFLGEIL